MVWVSLTGHSLCPGPLRASGGCLRHSLVTEKARKKIKRRDSFLVDKDPIIMVGFIVFIGSIINGKSKSICILLVTSKSI